MCDVCDEVVNDEEHKNQRGLLASVMKSRLSPSLVLNRIQCSRHVQGVLRCVRERWKGPEHRGVGCPGEGEDRSRVHSFQEDYVRTSGNGARRFWRYQCQRCSLSCRSWKGHWVLWKTIIDKELERSCVEKSERVLADSSTAERKIRQQVEQRRKECKQPKVQNRRERSMR